MGRKSDPNSMYGKCKQALRANPNLTAVQMAAETGVDQKRAAKYLQVLRRRNVEAEARVKARAVIIDARVAERAEEMIAAKSLKSGARPIPPTEDDVERVKRAALDPTLRLNMMAEIAANAKDEVRLRALSAIHELQVQAGAVQTLPDPTDPDEQIARAARVLEAIGREGADKAMLLAFAPRVAPSEIEAPEDLPVDAAAAQ